MKFKRFTRPQFLKGIGREMLGKFFGRFADELQMRKVALPANDLDDDTYFAALANVVMSPDDLPDALIEALFAIEELANAEGQEKLEVAVVEAGLALEFPEPATHGDIAVQVFLSAPALLATKHNETRLGRLSAFEYFGSRMGVDRSGSFVAPNGARLAATTAELDTWFKAHQRGHENTRIEVHQLDGECWFLVRHGDTFARTAKLEARRMEIMHFRPAKDDVVVYAPKRDEIRVHAGTKGEKELYRRAFGRLLFDAEDHFCERKAYTLEPLREDCAGALDTRDLPGITQIVLREVELTWGRFNDEFMVRGGVDILKSARLRGREAIPEYGTVARAVFDCYFEGQMKSRRVEIRAPSTVKMSRHCDARAVHEWLSARGFRINASEVEGKAVAA